MIFPPLQNSVNNCDVQEAVSDSNDDDIESIQNNLVKNPCFCMYPHPPSVGGASNVIIQMAAII